MVSLINFSYTKKKAKFQSPPEFPTIHTSRLHLWLTPTERRHLVFMSIISGLFAHSITLGLYLAWAVVSRSKTQDQIYIVIS